MKFKNLFKRLGQILYVNILWLICSLGLITGGAAFCGAYYVWLKLVDNEDIDITKTFFKGFRDNFKQGTLMWVITVLTISASICFWRLIANDDLSGVLPKIGAGVYTLIIGILNIYVYPLIARYENTFKNIIKNAFAISIQFLYGTILIAIVVAVEIYVTSLNHKILMASCFFLPGLIVFTVSSVVKRTFTAIEETV